MRHNPKRWGPSPAALPAIATLFILILAAGPAYAEKEKPNSSAKKEQKKSDPDKPGKSEDSASEENSGNPAGLEDIDRAWMDSIRGQKRPEGRSFSNPGSESEPAAEQNQPSANSEPGESPTASRMFSQEEGPSFFSLFIRFVLFMGLMAGGFYGLVRFMKKKSGIVSSSSGGPLRVVASISLMPGKYMQVVDMAGQLMVLGVSDNGVRLLQSIDDATVADRIRLWEENKPEPAENFLHGLQGLLKSTDFRLWKSRSEGQGNRTGRSDFQAILKGRAPDDDVPMEDLEELLHQQNRRLRAVSKPRPVEDGT